MHDCIILVASVISAWRLLMSWRLIGTRISATIMMAQAAQYVDGLMQERRNSSKLAMELRLSCINTSTNHMCPSAMSLFRLTVYFNCTAVNILMSGILRNRNSFCLKLLDVALLVGLTCAVRFLYVCIQTHCCLKYHGHVKLFKRSGITSSLWSVSLNLTKNIL